MNRYDIEKFLGFIVLLVGLFFIFVAGSFALNDNALMAYACAPMGIVLGIIGVWLIATPKKEVIKNGK